MDFIDAMDDETAALIFQLQLEDSTEIIQATSEADSNQNRNMNRDLSDAHVALNFYRRELQRNAAIVSDRVMTKSIAQVFDMNEPIFGNIGYGGRENEDDEAAMSQNTISSRQWSMDVVLERFNRTSPDWTMNEDEGYMENSLVRNRSMGKSGFPSFNTNTEPETSRRAATGKGVDIFQGSCTACCEKYPSQELARCPCNHDYCNECLSNLILASINEDGYFPPKCCNQPILLANIQMFLSTDLVERFETKELELATPDRTYCSNKACLAFIRPKNIEGDKASCPECVTITCVICKAGLHAGDCPADAALQNVLELAKDNGWQRCSHCRRMIELEMGCNHITCPCGTEFCYVCARPWKTCACPHWDEGLLLARAQVGFDQLPGDDILAQAEQAAAAMENLRIRENCQHNSWHWVRGRNQCEECFHTLRSYIFECDLCSMRACNRCRRTMFQARV